MIRSHWFWLFVVLTIATGLDYWNHISRPGSPFEEAPGAWFGFTAAAHLTFCAGALILAKLFGRMPIHHVIADTIGFAGAIALHLLITGPLWDWVFWAGTLRFDAVLVPVVISAVLYLFYRAVFSFVLHLRINPPKSLP